MPPATSPLRSDTYEGYASLRSIRWAAPRLRKKTARGYIVDCTGKLTQKWPTQYEGALPVPQCLAGLVAAP